jgi:hypothetical protein
MALPPGIRSCDAVDMKNWPADHGFPAQDRTDDELDVLGRPLLPASHACCCPAIPVVTVIMPPTGVRPHPVDLLLCGHHYRASQAALRAAGATAHDNTGMLIMASASDQPPGRREPAAAVPQR